MKNVTLLLITVSLIFLGCKKEKEEKLTNQTLSNLKSYYWWNIYNEYFGFRFQAISFNDSCCYIFYDSYDLGGANYVDSVRVGPNILLSFMFKQKYSVEGNTLILYETYKNVTQTNYFNISDFQYNKPDSGLYIKSLLFNITDKQTNKTVQFEGIVKKP